MTESRKAEVLQSLRDNAESTRDIHGVEWGSVYLDNVKLDGMTPHQFAGYLSALEGDGLYRAYDDGEFDGIWGDVRMA